jgi:ribosomal protein S18 acetylase RimI-like enzyme
LSSAVLLRNFSFPQDYPAIIQLWQNAGPGIHVRRSDEPEEIQKKLQRDLDLFLVAESDGKIIGSVIGGFDGRRGFVYHLAIDSAYRHAGIGTSLMQELEHRLKAKGCIRAYLFVTKDNQEVVHFYKQMGWETMDIIPLAKDIR